MTQRQTICIAAALVVCAVTSPRPAAQMYGYCGYFWVGGNDAGDYLYAWANLVIYEPSCVYQYGIEAGASVQAVSPWGTSDTGYAYGGGEGGEQDLLAYIFVPLDPAESGIGTVTGWGYISYFGQPVDYLYDQLNVPVPPPGGSGSGEDPPPEEEEDPPPPPDITITFSPSDSVTADYNSGDVYITAVVSPAGQGWEQQLYWVGDGEPTGYELERKFSTSQVRNFEVWAVIGTEEEIARVKVVPVVDLSPASPITVPVHPSEYVTVFAQVSPPGEATVQWSGEGWSYPEIPHIRYFSRAAVDQFEAVAQAGESKPKLAQVNVVQPPPVLRVVVDVNNDFAPAAIATTEDSSKFVPGANLDGSSVPVSDMRTTGQMVRLIAFFHVPGNPNQITTPPVSTVTLSLEDRTTWAGFAMNAGWSDARDTAPDYAFPPVGGGQESPSRQVDFGNDNIAVAELQVRDYGGRVRVRASGAGQEPTLSLPQDQLNSVSNWIPDAGWRAGPDQIDDNFSGGANGAVWTQDADVTSPAAQGDPNVGLQGDGLKVFEEYRGFVVSGAHVRTNPTKKDLFVSSRVSRTLLQAPQSVDFARSSLEEHGVRFHYLFDHLEASGSSREYLLTTGECPESPPFEDLTVRCERLLNFNSAWGVGLAPPSTTWQRIQGTLRLTVRSNLPGNGTGNMKGGCAQGGTTPALPAQAWWIFIDTARVEALAVNNNQNTNQVINNEVRRVVGHEIGHGLHVKHRVPPGVPTPPESCTLDSADVGSGASVMTYELWGNGDPYGDQKSKYNDTDVRQIRLHANTN